MFETSKINIVQKPFRVCPQHSGGHMSCLLTLNCLVSISARQLNPSTLMFYHPTGRQHAGGHMSCLLTLNCLVSISARQLNPSTSMSYHPNGRQHAGGHMSFLLTLNCLEVVMVFNCFTQLSCPPQPATIKPALGCAACIQTALSMRHMTSSTHSPDVDDVSLPSSIGVDSAVTDDVSMPLDDVEPAVGVDARSVSMPSDVSSEEDELSMPSDEDELSDLEVYHPGFLVERNDLRYFFVFTSY